MKTRTVLIAGAGGVGKTTVAAAIGVAAARQGLETLVLTVDPARRLADALGLEHLHNDPSATPLPHLSAAMLDAAGSWEAVVRRHADPEAAERVVASRFFAAVAERFPSGQAYAAAEEMAALLESGRFDLVVVDTPPSAGGIDFFSAPGRMRTLVGGRVLRWLTGARLPGRRRIYSLTARPVLKAADIVLGGPLLEDVAEFLLDLRTAYDGIARRARRIERLLASAVTVVVTTADPTPVRETMRFFRELPEGVPRPRVIIFNRALPGEWADHRTRGGDGPAAANLRRWGEEARRQHDIRVALAARHGVDPATIPWMPEGPSTLGALGEIAAATPELGPDRLLA